MRTKKRRLEAFLGLGLALSITACGSVTSPKPGLSIIASVSQQTAESLTFRIGVENTGSRTENLNFTSSQFFDIEIRNALGQLVWRYSAGAGFLDLIWAL
jgi:hypothetical protein